MMTKSDIGQNKGNVFADIGVSNPEQALARADAKSRKQARVRGVSA